MSQITAENTHPWSGDDLPTGVRFRPALTVTEDELGAACDALDRVLARV